MDNHKSGIKNTSNERAQNYDVINNEAMNRFEIHIEDKVAFEDYEFFETSQGEPGIVYLHTEVPKELGGQGIAGYLVNYILDYAEKNQLRVKPVCPFVKAYIDKHPEYQANSTYHQATP